MNLSVINYFVAALSAFALLPAPLISQQVYRLYDGPVPNSKPATDSETSSIKDGILIVEKVSRPTITAYLPSVEQSTGDAIIVCPGGGYKILAAGHEGEDVAKALNALGVTAFVLKYRIPDTAWMINPEIGPLQDAQRAIQFVRQNAGQWNINQNSIGIMGFSAGGHLASTAATHFRKAYIPNRKKISLRPDFLVLVYPVVSFSDSIAHKGSRDNLLGKDAPTEKITSYSNELQVNKNTPPTFLVHAKDDKVDYRNTIVFADALNKNGVFSEVLLFETGGHGFGLVNPQSDIRWIERMQQWLKKLSVETK